MAIAWVFPGQGSQAVGMGLDLLEVGQEKLAQAEQILGWSVLEKCQGEIAELSKTEYTQPCLYVVSAILLDILKAKGKAPDLVAGHSLGEYTALYCAGVLDYVTGLELVKARSLLMAEVSGGAMRVLMGFDRSKLEAIMAETDEVVLANDNSADQVVLSGVPEAIQTVCDRLKPKRALPLAVSGAFHSPMMAGAADQFAELLSQVKWQDAQVPVLSNVEPNDATTSGQILRDRLKQQMTSPVRWREICQYLSTEGYTQAVEVGAGKVLTGLIKRAAPGVQLVNISTLEQANAF
ncbi:ACP S-malonyltransferase [Tumidithrix elongata RA019]|uniref:Malonyl CoA-acyl carrier protein transacylase n=1 Tax=Tumidithrix elongata BACA0141 TaxID=2716417 RepID=A0AAW9Q7A4_9CYAN|nr:ACP S-malonyltransferase [Tumidithrix elongata RA019]